MNRTVSSLLQNVSNKSMLSQWTKLDCVNIHVSILNNASTAAYRTGNSRYDVSNIMYQTIHVLQSPKAWLQHAQN